MDEQLKEVLDIFHAHNIAYWLDSGTLLHLLRDKFLPVHDEDLDINIRDGELAALEKVLPLLRRAGYVLYSYAYRGMIFKYNCIPELKGSVKQSNGQDNTKTRVVDINIYRTSRDGNYAWCPLYYFRVNPGKETTGGREKGLKGLTRNILRGGWKKINARVPLHVDVGNLPWRIFVNMATWQIPQSYFSNIVYHEGIGGYIPADWENYLRFRYGDWQKPLREWVFYRDDGGVSDKLPEDMQ